MPSAPIHPDSRTRLWLPRPSLSACMRGVMSRCTQGVTLSEAQRFNHFPATPLCGITWWFDGTSEFLPTGAPEAVDAPRTRLPTRIVFSGPQLRPTVTWNPGEVHALMVLLMPDALQLMTGLDVARWVDRLADAHAVLPPPWVEMCDEILALPDDEVRVARLQDFLEPRWLAVRPRAPLQLQRYHDWAEELALRAATSGAGRSLRQVERRIKQWAGLPMRELRGVSRAERAFYASVEAVCEGERPHWSGVAQTSGYADQSHLCRASRRITGFAPDELYRYVTEDERFWSYRVWQ
jgi:AraC-like DNA-binding protein